MTRSIDEIQATLDFVMPSPLVFRGALSQQEFQEKLAAGEINYDDVYLVDDDIYIGDIKTYQNDEPKAQSTWTSRETKSSQSGKLRSYTCTHCGGSIDSNTMRCMYCGVKYFFS